MSISRQNEELDNQQISRSRDWLFHMEIGAFKLTAGGRPGIILAVGVPLDLIIIFGGGYTTDNPWLGLTIILTAMVFYSGLAAYWISKESKPK